MHCCSGEENSGQFARITTAILHEMHIPGRRLNGRCTLGYWRVDVGGNARCARASLINCRIIDFRIADHAHEERSLVGQCLFALAIEYLGDLVRLLLFEQFRGEIGDYVPGDLCEWNKMLISHIAPFACAPHDADHGSPMSSSVACWATAQNRMTYLSLTEAGTMCNLPEPLMLLNSFSFNLSEPTRRKQTKPSCNSIRRAMNECRGARLELGQWIMENAKHTLTSLQISNRLSLRTRPSNCLANFMCCRMYACNPDIP